MTKTEQLTVERTLANILKEERKGLTFLKQAQNIVKGMKKAGITIQVQT